MGYASSPSALDFLVAVTVVFLGPLSLGALFFGFLERLKPLQQDVLFGVVVLLLVLFIMVILLGSFVVGSGMQFTGGPIG